MPGYEFRPLRLSDAAAWASYACLPECQTYTSSTAVTVHDVAAVIQRTLRAEPNSPVLFAVVPDGSDTLVGTVGFHTISALNRTAEITYDVHPAHWGQGIASAACRAATQWGWKARGWQRIQATTLLPHLRSQRVLARCGYQREGLLRHFRLVRGVPSDYFLYAAVPGDLPPTDTR
jgi:RimJ/RimL family protein N-acetyltransferase